MKYQGWAAGEVDDGADAEKLEGGLLEAIYIPFACNDAREIVLA